MRVRPHRLSPARLFVGVSVLVCAAPTAHAAEVTDMPPALRGDVHIDYGGSYLYGGLEEENQLVGVREVERHDLDIRAEFSPYDGIAVVIGLPTTPKLRLGFTQSKDMVYDPATTSGTYLAGDISDSDGYWGASAHGFLIGAAFRPLSETYKRHFHITWRLDIAYRTPSPNSTLYSIDSAARRGAAPGGHGLFIGAAFSSDQGKSNPYLDLDFMWESPIRVEIVDDDGTQVSSGATIQPGATFDVTAGVEWVANEIPEKHIRVAVDLYTGFGYRSWADLPSGFSLPNVLDLSSGLVVTQGDHVAFRAGLALDYHINKWIGLRTGVEGRYYTPYTVENIYPVVTGFDTYEVAWTMKLTGRVRLKSD